ncbi:PilZ domain-containing protein [Phycisphaera mikurensis]|nr:PilZ domain-containing protein [Phycisphaera mikurensis]
MLQISTAPTRTVDADLDTGGAGVDTMRIWVSDLQWRQMLERITRASTESLGSYAERMTPATGARSHARIAGDFRCMIRLTAQSGHDDDAHGTFVVRTRNVGEGGIGFVHGSHVRPGTPCTAVLEPDDGSGLGWVLSGRVVWCRGLDVTDRDPELFDVGVQFDAPVNIGPIAA